MLGMLRWVGVISALFVAPVRAADGCHTLKADVHVAISGHSRPQIGDARPNSK
jgi:hypothetical protein